MIDPASAAAGEGPSRRSVAALVEVGVRDRRRRRGGIRVEFVSKLGQDRLRRIIVERENREAGRAERAGQANLTPHPIGRKFAVRRRGPDARIKRNPTFDDLHLISHQTGKSLVVIGVIHRADEIEIAGVDPLRPILSH